MIFMPLLSDTRPDPDTLLDRIRNEERRKRRGKLKIFLGYIAGVGKTYEMLKAAHLRVAEGIDVRVGLVETHGRKETDALLAGLTAIPRKTMEYRGVFLTEFDLDAALKYSHALILVDELAHSNVPGSRHLKRYQDIEELLDAGIDVYTTLNVQHIESLNDVIAQITGVIVRETVPDRVIDEAEEIEVVDLAPSELLQRLKDGKVYVPDMAAKALEKFFNEGNLYALREIALRRAAERVDEQMIEYMQTRAIPGPWAAGEHILVSVGTGPLSERLVRTARRQADRMGARLTAIYVETPAYHHLTREGKEQIVRTLELARKLGAETATVFGFNIASTVIDYARRHNITRILVGKTLRPRWQEYLFGSVVDQLIHDSGTIDVYVISSKEHNPRISEDLEYLLPAAPPKDYVAASFLVTLLVIAGWFIKSYISPTNLAMLFLLVVVIVAFRQGLRPAIYTAVISVLAFDFFFVPPYLTFRVSDTEYIITFAGMIIVGTLVSLLVTRARENAMAAETREKETATLYALSRDLAGAPDAASIISEGSRHIKEIFRWESVVLLPEQSGLLMEQSLPSVRLTDDDIAVATWAFRHDTIAGLGTDTLHGSRLRYIPLKDSSGVIGVLGVKPSESAGFLTHEQERVLMALASQMALALERVRLTRENR